MMSMPEGHKSTGSILRVFDLFLLPTFACFFASLVPPIHAFKHGFLKSVAAAWETALRSGYGAWALRRRPPSIATSTGVSSAFQSGV